MRLSKGQLDKILADDDYFWTLTNQWRDTDHCFDIDKTWQAIHYIFNWSEWGALMKYIEKILFFAYQKSGYHFFLYIESYLEVISYY